MASRSDRGQGRVPRLASRGRSCQTMRFGFVGCLACGEPFYAVPCGAADMSAHKGAEKVDDRYPATRLATSTGLAASAARLDPAAAAAPGDCVSASWWRSPQPPSPQSLSS